MKRIVFLFNMILTAFMINGCKDLEIQSQWTNDSYFLENSLISGHDVPNQYLEEIDASVALFNNAEYLYVIFSSSDVFINRQIRTMGLTVWVDDSDKKQKLYGVRHGGRNRSGKDFQIKDSFWGSLTSEQQKRLEQSHQEMQQMIAVVNDGSEKLIPPDNPEGPAVAEAFHGKEYDLAFRIPIEESEENLNLSQMRSVMIGLELGSTDREEQSRMGPPVEDMSPGGAIEDGSMGRRRGIMGNPKPEIQRFTNKEVWLRVILGEQSWDI